MMYIFDSNFGVKLTIPLSLGALIWSGYVMFDMYNFYINEPGLLVLKSFMGFFGLIIFSVLIYVGFHGEFLDFND